MPALSTAQQNLRPPPRVPARLNLSLPFESNPTLRRWGRLSNTLLEKKRLLDRTRQMRELNFQKELPFVSSLREELDRRTAPRPVVAPDTPPKQRHPLPESPWERLYRTEEERLTARDLLAKLPNSVRTVVMMVADPRNLIPVESFEVPLRNTVARARAGDALALAEITRNRDNLDRVTEVGRQVIRAQAQRDDALKRFREVERAVPAVRTFAKTSYEDRGRFIDTFTPGRGTPGFKFRETIPKERDKFVTPLKPGGQREPLWMFAATAPIETVLARPEDEQIDFINDWVTRHGERSIPVPIFGKYAQENLKRLLDRKS